MTVEWREIYAGGSAEAEERQFQGYVSTMLAVQDSHRRASGSAAAHRTLHAKTVAGRTDAELVIADDLTPALAAGALVAGARLPATVRFSNAAGVAGPDTGADLRGLAVKLTLPDGGDHDLLATSYPVSHVRDAAQFVKVAVIGSGSRALAVPRMLAAFGPGETLRILGNLRKASRRCESLALESYWSRGAVLWGAAGPVRFRFSPLDAPAPASPVPADDAERLRLDLAARLEMGAVRFAVHVQRFVDEATTPIEDGAVEWTPDWQPVGVLTIPAGDLLGAEGTAAHDHVHGLAFNPWNCPETFRPLGNLNRARRSVYTASAATWQK